MAVGKDADAHALAHANVGVRVVGSAVGESSCRARSEHVFDGRCNMATGAGEQRRRVLPLGSSSRDVVEEDFSLGVATIQQRQSQQRGASFPAGVWRCPVDLETPLRLTSYDVTTTAPPSAATYSRRQET